MNLLGWVSAVHREVRVLGGWVELQGAGRLGRLGFNELLEQAFEPGAGWWHCGAPQARYGDLCRRGTLRILAILLHVNVWM
jgi:hypothetical protein